MNLRVSFQIHGFFIILLTDKLIGPDENNSRGQGFLTQIEPTFRFKYTFENLTAQVSNIVSSLQVDNGENWGTKVWGELVKVGEGGDSSLSTTNVQQPEHPAPQAQESSAGASTTTDSNDPIIAKGKGFEIKRSQLDKVITGLQSAATGRGQTISPEQLATMKGQMLDRLIQVQILLQKTTDADRANGVQKADLQLNALLERTGSQEALERQMKAVGLTVAELRFKIIQENTAQAVKIRELNVTVTDAEAKQFYDDHPADFKSPDKISGKKTDYATVAVKIKDFLTQQKVNKLEPPYLEKLKKAADVQILDADLK